MCKWCKAREEILKIMKTKELSSRELKIELETWECEDEVEEEESDNEAIDNDMIKMKELCENCKELVNKKISELK